MKAVADYLRQTLGRKVAFLSIDNDAHKSYAIDFSDTLAMAFETQDTLQYVKAAIQRLPQSEALLITLYYMNENSLKEIE